MKLAKPPENYMMRHKLSILIISILLLPFIILKGQENDILNYENSVKYANYLFENQLYDLSAIEYERIVYLEPTDTLAKLRLVQSYRFLNKTEIAKIKLEGFFSCCSQYSNNAFAVEKFKILFLEKRYDECLQFISEYKKFDDETLAEMKAALLLMQNNWSDAKSVTESYLSGNSSTSLLSEFRNISLKGESIRYKNPFIAATMSGIIPGSGKFYAGQWKDGLYSFFVVTALSYITFRSFEKNGVNPYGFIFGTAAFSFYTANIYGSHKSAKRYNKTINAENVKDVERLIFEKK